MADDTTAQDLELTPEELIAKHEKEKAELHSNYERWAQKIIKEKKEKDFMLEAYDKLVADKANIVELADKNPELTQQVLDKFFKGVTIDEVKSQLGWADRPAVDVQKEIKKGIEQSKIKEKIESFISQIWLEGDNKEKFMEALEENTPKNWITPDNLDRILRHSLLDVNPDIEKVKELDNKTKVADSISAGWQKMSESKTKETDAITRQVQESIKKNKIF